MDEEERVSLGEAPYAEAKHIQNRLSEAGIRIELASDPDHCSSGGCAPKLILSARMEDLPIIHEILGAEARKTFEGLEFDAQRIANAVFDPEQAHAECPACGTKFSTKLLECPDCGLGFGVYRY